MTNESNSTELVSWTPLLYVELYFTSKFLPHESYVSFCATFTVIGAETLASLIIKKLHDVRFENPQVKLVALESMHHHK